MQAAEHIVLESDEREVPRFHSQRRVHATLQCRSRLQRRRLNLSIIDYYYLGVCMVRSLGPPQEYVLDLRFVDPSFVLSRHVPWRWIGAALALTAISAACAMSDSVGALLLARHVAAPAYAALLASTALAYWLAATRLVETVSLHSINGRAALLEYRGGAGTLHRLRPFLVKLAAHVQLAAAARRASMAEHLRDELREHYRLKEAGVLAAETYDACKRRVLARHE